MERRARDAKLEEEAKTRQAIADAEAAVRLKAQKETSVLYLQRVWRGVQGRRAGQRAMREGRLERKRKYWGGRADQRRRSTITYRLKDAFGMAEV